MNTERNKIDEELRKRNQKPPVVHSQQSLNEEIIVAEIVQTAWKNVSNVPKNSSTKIPKIKKQPMKSQESINEEKMLGEILTKAYADAEEIKKQTNKARKQAEKNRVKPKVHRFESIKDEVEFHSIVNTAWNDVYKEDLNRSTASIE